MSSTDGLPSADARARLAYLDDCAELLWPGSGPRGRVVLPGPGRPRILVPRRPRRAAVESLVRYTAQQPLRDRLTSRAVALAFVAGVLRRPAPTRGDVGAIMGADEADDADDADESVDDAVARLLGRPVSTSLALTHPRPNRKPVLQVFDRRGDTIAFAKVGVTPLARGLVDAEAAALAAVAAARPTALRVPQVLAHEHWRSTALLVASALPLGRPIPARELGAGGRLDAAMREISEIGRPDAMSDYLASLRTRAAALDDGAPYVASLDRLAGDADVANLPTGSWHGDWTQWNCAHPRRAASLVVWDWERFTAPAPRGYDALHFALNDRVTTGRSAFGPATRDLLDAAPRLLAQWALPAGDARRVAALYVLDLALRYRTDDTVQDVDQWALPLVRSVLPTDQRGASA